MEFRPSSTTTGHIAAGMANGNGLFFNSQGYGQIQGNDYWAQARFNSGRWFMNAYYNSNDGGDEKNPTFLYGTGFRQVAKRTALEAQVQYNFEIPSLNSDFIAGFDYRNNGSDSANTLYGRNEADDDFLIPGGIIPCIEFLNENADYCSAHGLYITHSVIQNNDGNQFNWMCQYIGKTGSEDSNSFKRTEQYLAGKSVLPFYAIHRNRDFVSIWNDTNEYISDWGLCEIFPCSLSLIKGKMKILSVFYSSREPNDSFWYDESRLQNIYSNDKCAKCINGLAINLQKQNNISLQIAILKIKKIIEQYIEYNFLNSTGHKYVNFLQISSIFKIISRKLIRRRNIKIRQYYKHVFANSDSQYYSDFLKLEQAVISANLDFSELNHARSTY
jgi:glycosyltransferase domain-containing protein